MKFSLDEIRMYKDDYGAWWLEVRQSGQSNSFLADTAGSVEDEIGRIRRFQICGKVDGDRLFFGDDLMRLYTALFRVRKKRKF